MDGSRDSLFLSSMLKGSNRRPEGLVMLLYRVY